MMQEYKGDFSNKANGAKSVKTAQRKGISLQDNRPNIVQLKANDTGLPDQLKSGIENLSGHSMDDVKVHYNSSKPAQLNAHAYAQGSQIHLASGQEKHLPHEAWHVVQQKQGRVKPTKQLKAKVNINDDAALEEEADAMGAKALQMKGDNSSGISKGHLSTGTIQMVHPAFNSHNYWKMPMVDPETGEQIPLPGSPEAKKKQLTGLLGSEVMKLILYSQLDSEDVMERENETIEFYKHGGHAWDAFFLLRKYLNNNAALKTAYRFYITGRTALVDYPPQEAASEKVQHLAKGFAESSSEDEIITRIKTYKGMLKGDPGLIVAIKSELIALDVAYKMKLSEEKGTLELLMFMADKGGMQIKAFGNRELIIGKAKANLKTLLGSLIKSPFINSRRPPLMIRININPGVSKDIANTTGHGSFIRINLDEYQLNEFSGGQLLGLVAHEVGVHSLDSTTLSKDESEAEELDKNSKVQGDHSGTVFKVGKQVGAEKQQDDHLTIGRGLLGQISAAPRLNMYEKTIVSMINAAKSKEDRKEAAAAYCIDISRILVLNDNPKQLEGLGKLKTMAVGKKIIDTAVGEWVRMKSKYGRDNPLINEININSFFIGKCLFKLKSLIEKVEKEGV
ncbi:MAG: DUF4157 domain-containing protein [Crocinitomix sp.]|nr:DUF4157 domain-containing protein [Crocinitomix sp.]